MKKILLLNGGKQFAHSDGQYNATCTTPPWPFSTAPVSITDCHREAETAKAHRG